MDNILIQLQTNYLILCRNLMMPENTELKLLKIRADETKIEPLAQLVQEIESLKAQLH